MNRFVERAPLRQNASSGRGNSSSNFANAAMKLALSMNPKCPPQTAVKFLNYLTDRDLGLIMRSRDVAGVISAQARRILARKGKT